MPGNNSYARIQALDIARGLAVLLMIFSHGVRGLIIRPFMPEFGIVPVHLLTKFSSTLFFIIFGMSLAVLYKRRAVVWPRVVCKLFLRALVIFATYKILTIVQLYGHAPPSVLKASLTFDYFPDFVEVLGFYSFCLLWLPSLIPRLSRQSVPALLLIIVGMLTIGNWLSQIWNIQYLRALKIILAEDSAQYTFGQLQRGALVIFGIMLAQFLFVFHDTHSLHNRTAFLNRLVPKHISFSLPSMLLCMGIAFLLSFIFQHAPLSTDTIYIQLWDIAKNKGKHPPNAAFIAFSMGGSLIFIALCFGMHQKFKSTGRILALLGRHSLTAFSVHIFILFVVFRNTLKLKNTIPYSHVVALTLLLVTLTIVFCELLETLKSPFRRD